MIGKRILRSSVPGIGLLVVLLGGVREVEAAEVQARLGFTVDSMVTSQEADGDRLQVTGCTLRTEQAGKPDLPVRLYRLVIPADLWVSEIRVTQVEFEPVQGPPGGFRIPPTLPSMPTDGSGNPQSVRPDPMVYGMDDPFPAEPVEYVSDEYTFGYHVATLWIHPLRYYPVSGRIEVLTQLVFELTGPQVQTEYFYALRRSEQAAALVRDTLARMVENTDQIDSFAPPTQIERAGDKRDTPAPVTKPWPSLEGLPVDYIIITSDGLVPQFTPLRDWKQRKGWNTVIRTVSQITACYPGVDAAERMRNFIIEAGQLWGAPWILLGGDVNQVPDRKGFDDYYASRGPTDLYFATAEGTWNANGNYIFGEGDDNVDEGIDFHVGRAPVEDAAEAALFVQKVLTYDRNPPANFASTALLMGATYDCVGWPTYHWGQWCKEEIKGIIGAFSDSYFIWRLYNFLTDNSTFWGDELLNHDSAMAHLNAGYHFVNHCDHSGVYAMGTGSKCWGGVLTPADAMALTNGTRAGVLISLGCSPNAFDYDSVSEAFMNNPNGGLVAYMGNTRTGYTGQVPQDTEFFRQVFTYGNTHLGQAFSNARSVYGGYYCRVLNLLGDPEMILWRLGPVPMRVTHPSMLGLGRQTVTIGAYEADVEPPPPVVGARVCLYKADEVWAWGLTGPDGTVAFDISCDTFGDVHLTVTAENRYPYEREIPVASLLPVPHLYVSAYTIDDDTTVIGNSDGNGDGQPDAGETLEIPLDITNSGGAPEPGVTVTLYSLTPQVTVLMGQYYIGNVDPGQTVRTQPFLVHVASDCPPETLATFRVEMGSLISVPHVDELWFNIHAPDLGINGNRIVDDGSGQSQGNGNGIVEPGETVEIYMELGNAGHGAARNVSAVATSNHQNLIVLDGQTAFGDIASMSAKSALDPLVVRIAAEFTGSETLTLVVSDHYQQRGTFVLDLFPPPAPSGLDFDAGQDFIDLTWLPVEVPDLLGYHVYRSFVPTGPFQRLDTLVQAGASLYHDALIAVPIDFEFVYYYVRAVDQSGNEGPASDTLKAWTTCPEHPGWPIKLAGVTLNAAAVQDVDGDGLMEIFIGGLDGKVYGFHHDGTKVFPLMPSGFAELDPTGSVWGAPSIGDLDRDGSPDVVVTSRGGENKAYAWSVFDANGDGAPDPVPGWPVYLGPGNERSLSAPALADVDGDRYLEVVFTVETGPSGQEGQVHMIDARGFEEIGWPKGGLAEWTYATPAVGFFPTAAPPVARDIPNGPRLTVLAGGRNGNIYAWDYQGNLLPGWPFATGNYISSSAALGDLDGDNVLEILQNSQNGMLYALEINGTEVAGWEGGKPYAPSNDLMPSPVFADLDGDNLPEVFLPTVDGIAAWAHDGNALPGWPVTLAPGHGTESSPAVADIDGDGEFEILVGSGDERLHALEEDGSISPHWPAHAGERVVATPTVADIDNDGDMEVIVGAAYWVHIWDCGKPYHLQKIQWGTFHAGVKRTGVYDPVPPMFGTGDSDIDGDVDLADFADFQVCFQDPSGTVALEPWCRFFDFEPDNDVDLADYAAFFNLFVGPVPD